MLHRWVSQDDWTVMFTDAKWCIYIGYDWCLKVHFHLLYLIMLWLNKHQIKPHEQFEASLQASHLCCFKIRRTFVGSLQTARCNIWWACIHTVLKELVVQLSKNCRLFSFFVNDFGQRESGLQVFQLVIQKFNAEAKHKYFRWDRSVYLDFTYMCAPIVIFGQYQWFLNITFTLL